MPREFLSRKLLLLKMLEILRSCHLITRKITNFLMSEVNSTATPAKFARKDTRVRQRNGLPPASDVVSPNLSTEATGGRSAKGQLSSSLALSSGRSGFIACCGGCVTQQEGEPPL